MPEISLPLYHQEQGDPTLPCLVILHGLFGASVNFTSLAKTLSEYYRVIRFDLPNHGRSPHTEQHTYPIMADAVTTSLAALGVERCCVLGHSMGGKVAMQLAAAQPNLVERLIVVDIAPVQYPEDSHRDVLTAMAAVAAAAVSDRTAAEAVLSQWIHTPSLRQFLLSNLQRRNGRFEWRVNLDVITRDYPQIAAAPMITAPCKQPTLFIRGSLSNYIVDEYWQQIQRSFPAASLKSIEGAGHWLHAEAPQPFLALVKDFLTTS